MTGRGRRAVLPPADHRTEPLLAPDGLVVTVVNNAGYTKAFDFAELSVPEPMQGSLATVFAARAPGWTSHATAQGYWIARPMPAVELTAFLEGKPPAPAPSLRLVQ